jgi:hypothetical protein
MTYTEWCQGGGYVPVLDTQRQQRHPSPISHTHRHSLQFLACCLAEFLHSTLPPLPLFPSHSLPLVVDFPIRFVPALCPLCARWSRLGFVFSFFIRVQFIRPRQLPPSSFPSPSFPCLAIASWALSSLCSLASQLPFPFNHISYSVLFIFSPTDQPIHSFSDSPPTTFTPSAYSASLPQLCWPNLTRPT